MLKVQPSDPPGSLSLPFEIQYAAVLGNPTEPNAKGQYLGDQFKNSSVTAGWDVARASHGGQNLVPDANLAPQENHIIVSNTSGDLMNIGIAMDGSPAVMLTKVYSGVNVNFSIHPTYFVGLVGDVLPSVSIDSVEFTHAQPVDFSKGSTAVVTAEQIGAILRVSVSYEDSVLVPLSRQMLAKGIDFITIPFSLSVTIMGLGAALAYRIITSPIVVASGNKDGFKFTVKNKAAISETVVSTTAESIIITGNVIGGVPEKKLESDLANAIVAAATLLGSQISLSDVSIKKL
jgi:hypothetical protein